MNGGLIRNNEGVTYGCSLLDLKLQHDNLHSEIETAIWRVINNSAFILGPEVEAFEKAFANYIGVRHAIGQEAAQPPSRWL